MKGTGRRLSARGPVHHARCGPIKTEYSRGDFLRASVRALRAPRARGVRNGMRASLFLRNSVASFRLAAVSLDVAPQSQLEADTTERVLYKLNVTGATLVLHDSSRPSLRT